MSSKHTGEIISTRKLAVNPLQTGLCMLKCPLVEGYGHLIDADLKEKLSLFMKHRKQQPPEGTFTVKHFNQNSLKSARTDSTNQKLFIKAERKLNAILTYRNKNITYSVE